MTSSPAWIKSRTSRALPFWIAWPIWVWNKTGVVSCLIGHTLKYTTANGDNDKSRDILVVGLESRKRWEIVDLTPIIFELKKCIELTFLSLFLIESRENSHRLISTHSQPRWSGWTHWKRADAVRLQIGWSKLIRPTWIMLMCNLLPEISFVTWTSLVLSQQRAYVDAALPSSGSVTITNCISSAS